MYCTLRSKAIITAVAKLTPSKLWALPRPPGLKTLISIKFVADDIQADQEHAVGHQFGPHDLHDPQGPLIDLGLGLAAAGVDIAANIVARAEPAEGGRFALIFQRVRRS